MKKILFSIFIILLTGSLFSQVHFGFKFGGGLTKTTNRPFYPYANNSLEPVWQPGFAGGITMDVEISDIFFLQWDLLYAQTNTLYDLDPNIHDPDQPSPGKSELNTSINSVQMPIVVRFATYDKKVTTYFETGFYGGYAFDGKYTITSEDPSQNESAALSFENYKRGDFGFVVGFGFGTGLGKRSSWALNLRYLFSTFDAYKYPDKSNDDYIFSQYRMLYLSFIIYVI